jgi:hypothetical protein
MLLAETKKLNDFGSIFISGNRCPPYLCAFYLPPASGLKTTGVACEG